MKKISWLLIFFVLFMGGLSAFAWWGKGTQKNIKPNSKNQIEFEILPTMDTVSNAKNFVWVGTFQLVWNDLIDEIIGHPVEFLKEEPDYTKKLNSKNFTSDFLREESFYKKLGLVSKELKVEIESAIKEKFGEKSDILNRFDWAPAPEKYILYAMLKKDFEYIKPFDKLEEGEFAGSKGNVKYFGIDNDSSRALRHTISVLFYNNPTDFAVLLKSKQGDMVYIYRTNDNKTLADLYEDMIKKSDKYMGIRTFGNKDEFKVPYIDFKKEREFKELCNKPIKNSNFMIFKAIETVQFKMNETGVKLKSEAGLSIALACCPDFRDKPRYFYCDGSYAIFLQEKTKPYFGMKINDAKSLQ